MTNVPSFATGTMITTLKGEKPVESLQPGDRVITRDNGLQTVRRIDRRDFSYGQLASVPHLAPILITIGAMGPGLPERDMLVSRQMRILVSADRVPFGHHGREALVAAAALGDGNAIRGCQVLGVRYVHIVLDKNEVILANGIWAEAFQAHDQMQETTGQAQAEELAQFFPALAGEAAVEEPLVGL